MCRQANSQYEYDRSHGLKGERELVGEAETQAARKRVNRWRGKGIGLRTTEKWTGVHRSSLQTLVLGNHPNCNGATKRLSRESYEAIMGCDEISPAQHANVDSRWALEAADKLLAAGWTKARISEESGVPYQTLVALTCRRRECGKCSQATHEKLCRLWRKVAHHGRGSGKARLEDWQWAEARHDYEHGVRADALAERYGVSEGTVKAHMKKHGTVFASAVQLHQAGRKVAEGADRFGSRRV